MIAIAASRWLRAATSRRAAPVEPRATKRRVGAVGRPFLACRGCGVRRRQARRFGHPGEGSAFTPSPPSPPPPRFHPLHSFFHPFNEAFKSLKPSKARSLHKPFCKPVQGQAFTRPAGIPTSFPSGENLVNPF